MRALVEIPASRSEKLIGPSIPDTTYPTMMHDLSATTSTGVMSFVKEARARNAPFQGDFGSSQ
jgi:hypothetical protein